MAANSITAEIVIRSGNRLRRFDQSLVQKAVRRWDVGDFVGSGAIFDDDARARAHLANWLRKIADHVERCGFPAETAEPTA